MTVPDADDGSHLVLSFPGAKELAAWLHPWAKHSDGSLGCMPFIYNALKMRGLDQLDGPRGKDFIIVRASNMPCIWCLVMTLPTMGDPRR